MNSRNLIRLGLALLLAAGATGCETLRGFRSTFSPAPPPPLGSGNPTIITGEYPGAAGTSFSPPDTLPSGTVIAAGGAAKVAPGNPQVQPVEGVPQAPPTPMPMPVPQLPAPRPLPAPAGQPQSGVRPPGYPTVPSQFADPRLRGTPTVAGEYWNLAPWETPTDRLAELTRHLETLLAQNKALLARAKELEALGISREQALAEAMREIDSVTAAAAKEKAVLLAQVTGLQARIQQIEEEDIQFLEAVIEALKKLLPPEKKP